VGKSELLRTLVLGLAATHSSEALNFVLVDFKGGATFASLDRLPHTSAVITNLSDTLPLVDRMKDAMTGELTRRQELLRRTGPFSSLRDYDRPPYTIVGANAPAPVEALRRLLGHLPCEFHATSIWAAETVKYCSNNFHALKITFANEIARLCEALGVDPFEVMDLVCRDTQLNISRAYLRPGFAFGGSCLPKDLRASLYLAKTRDVELPITHVIVDLEAEREQARTVA